MTQSAYSQDNSTLSINGLDVKISSASIINEEVLSVMLAESAEFEVGRNRLFAPKGSRIALQKNQGQGLSIAGLIVNAPVPNQSWTLSNGKELQLNCGKYKLSPAFIKLSRDFELLDGCTSVKNQILQNLKGDQLTIHEASKISFFPNGALLSSSMTSGAVHINNDEAVVIEWKSSLRYHTNGKIYFLHPIKGEHFHAPTEVSPQTAFWQPFERDNFPVMFHENGQISTAILSGQNEYDMEFTAYGSEVSFSISTGPVGFDEHGNIDRILSANELQLNVQEDTFIRSTEVTTDIASYGKYTVGMQVTISERSQLFLTNENGVKRLRAYPENGLHGFIYFNELSDEPFIESQEQPLYSVGLNN